MRGWLFLNYEATRQRFANESLPDWVRNDPFDSLWDLQWFDRLLRWFVCISLVLVWGPNLFNCFECSPSVAHHRHGKSCRKVLRFLENLVYTCVGIVLLVLLFVHHGVDFSRAIAFSMVAMWWVVIALALLCAATAGTAYSFRVPHQHPPTGSAGAGEGLRTASSMAHAIIGIALLLAMPYDDWSSSVLQAFAGILIFLGALVGRASSYLAFVTRSKMDRATEHLMYLLYSIAAVLMCCIQASSSFPIGYCLDDRSHSVLWPIVIFLMTLLVCCITVQLLWLCIGGGYKQSTTTQGGRRRNIVHKPLLGTSR
jgi:hypothetical protein